MQIKDVDSITLDGALQLLRYPVTLVCLPIFLEFMLSFCTLIAHELNYILG